MRHLHRRLDTLHSPRCHASSAYSYKICSKDLLCAPLWVTRSCSAPSLQAVLDINLLVAQRQLKLREKTDQYLVCMSVCTFVSMLLRGCMPACPFSPCPRVWTVRTGRASVCVCIHARFSGRDYTWKPKRDTSKYYSHFEPALYLWPGNRRRSKAELSLKHLGNGLAQTIA